MKSMQDRLRAKHDLFKPNEIDARLIQIDARAIQIECNRCKLDSSRFRTYSSQMKSRFVYRRSIDCLPCVTGNNQVPGGNKGRMAASDLAAIDQKSHSFLAMFIFSIISRLKFIASAIDCSNFRSSQTTSRANA